MTNLEYIRTMDKDEFFDFIEDINLDKCICPARSICHKYHDCSDAFKGWLQSEYIKER